MTIKLIYIGRGDALIGVPARDLTEEDFKERELDEAELLKSGLYQKPDIKADKPKQKKAGE